MAAPVSSNNSVGNGPAPTRVQYALKIPNTSPILFGAMPKPVHAPAQTVFEEVTKGYEPKSTSSSDPCAPSHRIALSSCRQWFTKCSESITRKRFRYSTPFIHSASSASSPSKETASPPFCSANWLRLSIISIWRCLAAAYFSSKWSKRSPTRSPLRLTLSV